MVAGVFGGPVENSYKPIPEGVYTGYVTKLEIRTSKAGNDYLNLEFTLENNRKVWDRLMWHNEACINVMKGKLESLGFTREERHQLDPDQHQPLIAAVNFMTEGKVYEIKVGFDKDGNNVVKYFSDLNAKDEEDPLDPAKPAPVADVFSVKGKKPRIQSPWPN